MNNYIHIVWQILPPLKLSQVRQNLLKYTAQQFKFALLDGNNEDENEGNTYKVVGDNTNNGGIYDKVLNEKKQYAKIQQYANVGVITNILIPNRPCKFLKPTRSIIIISFLLPHHNSSKHYLIFISYFNKI